MRKIGIFVALIGCLGAPTLLAEQDSGHRDDYYSHRDGSVSPAAEKNFGNQVIYQIVVDRFRNGNTANDCLNGGRFCRQGTEDDWYSYQGGDLRGIINTLPYLKSLGVSHLWLTPIVENQNVIVKKRRHGRLARITSYHGYWAKDWFQLNPYFTDSGTRDFAIVDELIDRAGTNEIKIFLDTVANHTSPLDATEDSLAYLASETPIPAGNYPRSHRGALFRDGRYVTSYTEDEARKFQSGYRWMFHQSNHTIGDPDPGDWQKPHIVQTHNLEALADLDQDNPIVYRYILDAHRFWLNRFPGLAGYRMDTIKHVKDSYWESFSRELYREFPQLEVFGEYFDGGPLHQPSHRFYRNTRMSMIDFDFRNAMRSVFKYDASFAAITNVWRADPQLRDARDLVTYLDSHDQSRLRGESDGGLSYQRMRQMIAMWLVSRGIPCIYYGMEQDLFHPNDVGDPYNRPMMTRFDQNNPMFRFMQNLIKLRRTNTAARYGETHVVHETQNIIGFERLHGDDAIFFATSKNPITGSDRFDMLNARLPDGLYKDVLSGKIYNVQGGRVPVSLRDGDIIVLSTTKRVDN